MTDLLIRDIDPDLMLLIEQRARTHNRNVSQEAKALIRAGSTRQNTTARWELG